MNIRNQTSPIVVPEASIINAVVRHVIERGDRQTISAFACIEQEYGREATLLASHELENGEVWCSAEKTAAASRKVVDKAINGALLYPRSDSMFVQRRISGNAFMSSGFWQSGEYVALVLNGDTKRYLCSFHDWLEKLVKGRTLRVLLAVAETLTTLNPHDEALRTSNEDLWQERIRVRPELTDLRNEIRQQLRLLTEHKPVALKADGEFRCELVHLT